MEEAILLCAHAYKCKPHDIGLLCGNRANLYVFDTRGRLYVPSYMLLDTEHERLN